MGQPILMYNKEPSDQTLSKLMKEVAIDAKKKALIAQQQLAKKIKNLIQIASEKN